MKKYINDVSKDYNLCIKIENLSKFLYCISIILTIIICLKQKNKILCFFLIIIHVIYVFINTINDLLFKNNAENERRKTLLSNSFNSNLTNKKTNGFYNNNNEKDSIKKLGLNMFESVLFSKNNSNKMLKNQNIKIFIDIIIWLVVILLFKDNNLVLCITQCIFSSEILIDYFKLLYFYFKTKELYNKTYILFITNKYNSSKKAQLFEYVLEYECLKSYSHILLSEKVFNLNNLVWSNEWNNLKKEIK